jgi:hypothetical protein
MPDEEKTFEVTPFHFQDIAASCEVVAISVAEVNINLELFEREEESEAPDFQEEEWVTVKHQIKRQIIKFTIKSFQECYVLVLITFVDDSKRYYIFHFSNDGFDEGGELFSFMDDKNRSLKLYELMPNNWGHSY